MKKTLLSLIALSFLCFSSLAQANEEEYLQGIEIPYQEVLHIDDEYIISISDIAEKLESDYPESSFLYTWDIFGESPQNGEKLTIKFSSTGKKQISLNIYQKSKNEEQTLIYNTSIFPVIYKYSIPLLTDLNLEDTQVENYINSWKDAWVLFYEISSEWSGEDIQKEIKFFYENYKNKSNYIVLWWAKEFLFYLLNQFNLNNSDAKNLNFVLLSSYNNSIIRNYIENSLAGKNVIWEAFILEEIFKTQILKSPKDINIFKQTLTNSGYEYLPITPGNQVIHAYFISNFINALSKSWVNNTEIYIILLLPIFFTIVAFSKHIVGLSTLWNLIPIFLWILFIKIWFLFTFFVFAFLILFNIALSSFLSRYTLLYTPKISLITITNILFFMLFYSLTSYLFPWELILKNILYVIIFFIISEKLVSIISTKEFREYKKNIIGSIIIWLLCYGLFTINSLLVFLYAYPEILLIFIPINFILGRFTWLRISEYFRFNEILKTIEEE